MFGFVRIEQKSRKEKWKKEKNILKIMFDKMGKILYNT